MALDTVWRGMICKQLINIYLGSSNSCLIFSQLPQIGQNVSYFGVYVGCLEGISEVSGDCLGDSVYWGGLQSIGKNLIRLILLTGSFSPSCLG